MVDTKLGTHATLETQSQTQPKWTIVSRGRVSIALNESWTLAWRNSSIQVNTDGKGEACRSMLLQIPCPLLPQTGHIDNSNVCPQHQCHRRRATNLSRRLRSPPNPRESQAHSHSCRGFQRRSRNSGSAHSGSRTPHGPRKRNLRGQNLIQFCTQQGLVEANTWTPQHHKTTWWHPRFNTPHLLDYFLVAKKHLGNVHRVLTMHPEVAWQALQRDWTPYTHHSPIEMQIKLAKRIPTTTHPHPSTRHIQRTGALSKCSSFAETLPR